MKRHISIFAFLLCAVAAVGPLAAHALQFRTYGIQKPSSDQVDPALAESYFGTSFWGWQIFVSDLPRTVSVNMETPGWTVDCWLKQFFKLVTDYKENAWEQLNEGVSADKSKYVFNDTNAVLNTSGCFLYVAVKFKYVPLTVSFRPNGGSGSMSSISDRNIDSEFDLPTCQFTRAGYSMTGWTNDVEMAFDDGQKNVKGSAFWNAATTNFSSVLYANWKANDSTLSYDLAGGNWSGGSAPSFATFDKAFELRHPVKPGSTFSGWKVIVGLDPSTAKYGSSATAINSSISSAETLCKGSGDSTFFLNVSTAPGAAVKFQAVWAAEGYTVTFDNQGADSGKGGISSMEVEYTVKPRDLEDNEIPFKTGFDFQGYFETTGGQTMHWSDEGVYVKKSWPYTEGKTLYAGWNAHHYSISYEGLEDATGYPTSAAYGETFALARPTKTGYKFAGWNVTAGLASKDAKWGESTELVNRSIDYSWDDIVPSDRNPTGTVYIRNLNTNDNAQVTLTANWVEVKYKATFEIAGAKYTPTMEVEVAYNGVLPPVSVVPEYLSGEIFRGYFTEPNGQGEQFWDAGGNPYPEGRIWPFDGNRTLYEYKTGFDYYITYDANGGEGAVSQQSCNSSNDVTLASGEELHRSGFRLRGWDFNKDISFEKCAFQPSQIISASDLKVKKDGDTAALFAIWQDKHVRIAIDATGGTAYTNGVKVTSLTYVDGEKYGFLPTAEKQHYVFAGWFTQAEDGERILEDSIVDYETVKTLYAHWTPEKFFVAFDRNGATNTDAMAVQEFAWDEEKALSKNLYGRTGYTFGGWATNTVTMKKVFDDCQVVSNLVGTADATQTVFAVWHTNSYTVVFNPNGGTGTMANQPFVYDQPQELLPNGFTRGELWSFEGWTNSVAGGPLYTNQETVVNLTADPNGRVELTAVWKSELSDLALAMGCDNLNWTDSAGKWFATTNEWTDGSTISCACVTNAGDAYMDSSAITTNGVLHFWWKATGAELDLQYLFNATYKSDRLDDEYSYGMWNETNIVVSLTDLKTDSALLSFFHWKNGICWIAKLTWTPEGSHPEPVEGEDNVTISSAAVSDGKFTLSFKSDERFDYNLLTNANLLIDGWGVMETQVGNGDIRTFEPQIIEGQPQLFYRVDTIQRK